VFTFCALDRSYWYNVLEIFGPNLVRVTDYLDLGVCCFPPSLQVKFRIITKIIISPFKLLAVARIYPMIMFPFCAFL
jgi:hypothetical protein